MSSIYSVRKTSTASNLSRYRWLYFMILPGLAWYFLYRYVPMYGIVIAFKDFNFSRGILGSEWVGLKHFRYLFNNPDFYAIVRNTLIINIYQLALGFPVPIILALLMNELKSIGLKRVIQTIIYFPHFLSWVVFGGIVIQLLSPGEGLVNEIIRFFGGKPVFFLARSAWFRPIVVISSILKESGWSAIIYMAALSGIDTEQYEAATMDGANRFQRLKYITIPGISSTVIVMLILRVGYLLDVGFEQIYILYNPAVYDVADVISTYIYRIGLQNAQFAMTTAIGLFQSAIGFLLIYATNYAARRNGDVSLW